MLVRLLLRDDPVQASAAARAFEEASLIAVTIVALCEVVWVLARGYKRPNSEIISAIQRFLQTEKIVIDRAAAEAGLAFLEAGADFADGAIAYQGARFGGEVFLTFDRKALAAATTLGIDAAAP